jgi:translation elongation factor EF-G
MNETAKKLFLKPDRIRNIAILASDYTGRETLVRFLSDDISEPVDPSARRDSSLSVTCGITRGCCFFESNFYPECWLNLTEHQSAYGTNLAPSLLPSDGCFLVINSMNGFKETDKYFIEQAGLLRVKICLIISNFEEFLEANESEKVADTIIRLISEVNDTIESFGDQDKGDWQNPLSGNVCFTGTKWAISLPQVIEFFDKEWNVKGETRSWEDIICEKFVIPLKQLFSICHVSAIDWELLNQTVNNQFPLDQELSGTKLIQSIMGQLWPDYHTLIKLAVNHLPSPVVAQPYRVGVFYTNPLNDETAQAIRKCDPNGMTLLFVYQIGIALPKRSGVGLLHYARILSGHRNRNVREELYCIHATHTSTTQVSWMAITTPKLYYITEASAGNIVCLNSRDVLESSTFSSSKKSSMLRGLCWSNLIQQEISGSLQSVNVLDNFALGNEYCADNPDLLVLLLLKILLHH